MFGFNFLRGVHGRDQNLPRIRVSQLAQKQINSCLVEVNSFEMFFIETQHKVDNSSVVLLGMRSQRLFRDGEKSLAVLLNAIRSNYGCSGVLIYRVVLAYNVL